MNMPADVAADGAYDGRRTSKIGSNEAASETLQREREREREGEGGRGRE